MIPKAAASDADVVVIDLEDAVVPDAKVDARRTLVDAVVEHDFGHSTIAYRINGTGTPWCLDDLVEVITRTDGHIGVVVVPKVTSEREVWFVDDVLRCLEASLDLDSGAIGIEVLIEEAEALLNAQRIALASSRIEALVLGVGDLAASLGMRMGHIGDKVSGRHAGYPGDPWHHARCQIIAAARAAGVEAIDGPFSAFGDLEGFERAAAEFALLGGAGKWCIHPGQISPANEVYSPTVTEFAEALDVVASVSAAARDGRGAAVHDGRMIDAASARNFEVLVERGRAAGLDR